MSAQENLAIVRRFFDEVCNERKLESGYELFAAGHVYHDPAIPGVPTGVEGMVQVVATYHKGLPDAHWQVDEMVATDDTVVTRWTGSGTQTGEVAGNPPIPPTGKSAKVSGIWMHRLVGGKIVESWNVWDSSGFLQQLGVIPAAA